MLDYRKTLNLPRTEFSMKASLTQREPEILKHWEDIGLYRLIRQRRKGRAKYILHDGPPYANGRIHIGHALNKILKDIIVKYKTMQGLDSPFVPGWDCHGLPVEHQLFKELGKSKDEISQVEFREKAFAYANSFVQIQKEEFKRLGIFGDWQSPYLTLSFDYEYNILKSLAELLKRGFIYRDLKPVNWCFNCETALAEAEVEYEMHTSPSIYIKFKIKETSEDILRGACLLAWTTTPWTLVANQALALHPHISYCLIKTDNLKLILAEQLSEQVLKTGGLKEWQILHRFSGEELVRKVKSYEHPFIARSFGLVLADFVSKEEGSGIVHIAPDHGEDDFYLGLKYGLKPMQLVDQKGKFLNTDNAPPIPEELQTQEVFKANDMIIERMRSENNLFYADRLEHSYPHCWRCKKPIITRATEQWFLNIDHKDLRKRLLDSLRSVRWVPQIGENRISAMISSRPHWCLSRQRYWGVPFPSVRCKKCNQEMLEGEVLERFAEEVLNQGSHVWFSKELGAFLPPGFKCRFCKGCDFEKGEDILDVWFESGVSFRAVLMSREDLLYPADLYLEGSDQHRGWFQTSLIPSVAIEKRAPFKAVLTHGFTVDGRGEKMSKSLGNVVAPQEVIKKYGAEILRLWVASCDYRDDVRISDEIILRLVDAYRKIRNTLRYLLGNLYDFEPKEDSLKYEELLEIDRWALSRLTHLVSEVSLAYEDFIFHRAYRLIYRFCIEEMSSFYLDILKDRLYTFKSNSLPRRSAQTAIYEILLSLIKLLSPILSFTCEEIFKYLNLKESSVHLLEWPKINNAWLNPELEEDWQRLIDLRNIVLKRIEEKREAGIIRSSLEAEVNLEINEKDFEFFRSYLPQLASVFITSCVNLKRTSGESNLNCSISKAKGEKCARCWNYSLNVGKDEQYPAICERCLKAIKG